MTSDIQKNVLELIDRWEKEQLDFLITLCEQNSYTFHKQGTDRVTTMILEKVEGIFPFHKIVNQREVGDHHILKTKKTGKAVYLLGHTDTVFPPDHPFQTCKKDGDWLMGPGTADMKGGLAVMVYALRALKQAGGFKPLNVAMILGGDEENGSSTSRGIYEEERENAMVCLVGECAGEKGEIAVSRNGKAGGRLECLGRDRHVGSASEEKISAILELARKVIAFESLNSVFPGVYINVGQIEGGLGPGTVPAQASFLFDLRWQKEERYGPLLDRIQMIVSQSDLPQISFHMTLLNYRPAMPCIKKTKKLLDHLQRVAKELGQEILSEHRYGTSDGNFFGAAGVPTLDGFGPIGLRDHTTEERIRISSLKERTALLALFLLHLTEADFGSFV
ncbi:MAG: M20/M25/M40 family metallo-hydrolase [Candidatus Aminicenantes bacterium]|nr:M20/M25/M40 family metallo-hydrolase [Candidatus Aminicenantes bacterium]